MMLDARGDHVIARLHQPEIARLSPSVPPLVKTISDARQPSKAATDSRASLHRSPRLLPMMMDGRGIAEVLPKIWPHGLEHLGQNRGGGVIVEIDAVHHGLNFYFNSYHSSLYAMQMWPFLQAAIALAIIKARHDSDPIRQHEPSAAFWTA